MIQTCGMTVHSDARGREPAEVRAALARRTATARPRSTTDDDAAAQLVQHQALRPLVVRELAVEHAEHRREHGRAEAEREPERVRVKLDLDQQRGSGDDDRADRELAGVDRGGETRAARSAP